MSNYLSANAYLDANMGAAIPQLVFFFVAISVLPIIINPGTVYCVGSVFAVVLVNLLIKETVHSLIATYLFLRGAAEWLMSTRVFVAGEKCVSFVRTAVNVLTYTAPIMKGIAPLFSFTGAEIAMANTFKSVYEASSALAAFHFAERAVRLNFQKKLAAERAMKSSAVSSQATGAKKPQSSTTFRAPKRSSKKKNPPAGTAFNFGSRGELPGAQESNAPFVRSSFSAASVDPRREIPEEKPQPTPDRFFFASGPIPKGAHVVQDDKPNKSSKESLTRGETKTDFDIVATMDIDTPSKEDDNPKPTVKSTYTGTTFPTTSVKPAKADDTSPMETDGRLKNHHDNHSKPIDESSTRPVPSNFDENVAEEPTTVPPAPRKPPQLRQSFMTTAKKHQQVPPAPRKPPQERQSFVTTAKKQQQVPPAPRKPPQKRQSFVTTAPSTAPPVLMKPKQEAATSRPVAATIRTVAPSKMKKALATKKHMVKGKRTLNKKRGAYEARNKVQRSVKPIKAAVNMSHTTRVTVRLDGNTAIKSPATFSNVAVPTTETKETIKSPATVAASTTETKETSCRLPAEPVVVETVETALDILHPSKKVVNSDAEDFFRQELTEHMVWGSDVQPSSNVIPPKAAPANKPTFAKAAPPTQQSTKASSTKKAAFRASTTTTSGKDKKPPQQRPKKKLKGILKKRTSSVFVVPTCNDVRFKDDVCLEQTHNVQYSTEERQAKKERYDAIKKDRSALFHEQTEEMLMFVGENPELATWLVTYNKDPEQESKRKHDLKLLRNWCKDRMWLTADMDRDLRAEVERFKML